jgi:hypothetical protein
MNIYTTEGLVSRYVTDWAGPSAVLRRISLRLGVSNHPGDTMQFNGVVRGLRDGGELDVDVTGINSLGEHVVAAVTLRIPEGGDG